MKIFFKKIYINIITFIKVLFIRIIGLYNFLIDKKCFIIILSGPPAIGKNTVCEVLIKNLKKNNIKIYFIKSYTTRCIRNDKDINNYNFISKNNFENKIKQNQMLEYIINPNNSHYYGFDLSDIKYNLLLRKNIIVIPTHNFLLKIKNYFEKKEIKYCKIISIYLLPNSMQDIKSRIKLRASENTDEIKRRIKSVKDDIKTSKYYDIKIINKKSSLTANFIKNIILKNFYQTK